MLASRLGVARAMFAARPSEQTVAEAQAALVGLEARTTADHPDLAAACAVVGRMHAQLGHCDRAEPYLRRALSIYKDPARSTPWELADARLRLAQCVRNLGHEDEAEQLLLQSIKSLETAEAGERLRTSALTELAELYTSQGRNAEAARIRATLGAAR